RGEAHRARRRWRPRRTYRRSYGHHVPECGRIGRTGHRRRAAAWWDQTEDGAVIIGPAGVGRPVENSRAIFHQGTLRVGAIGTLEVIESSEVPAGADFKDGAQAVGSAAVG